MTIKEMENLTGMTRANIRFYETEGLISPERKENGYRTYSDGDAQTLLKIRLLRMLDISIEEIKLLQKGKYSLEEILRRQLDVLSQQRTQLEHTITIAREMLSRQENFQTMDARLYLTMLEKGDASLQQDVGVQNNHPWRRYFARDFDWMLCSLLLGTLLPLELDKTVRFLLGVGLMVLLEPLCLSLFATTPGKAIFGIRVRNLEGKRLTYSEAIRRTCGVLWEGECLRIPLICEYYHYKSYQAAEEGELLPWEEDSELSFRDEKNWRWGLYLLCCVGIFVLAVLLALWEEGLL